jgi:hypothetical protein
MTCSWGRPFGGISLLRDACRAPDEAAMAVAQGAQWIRQLALPNILDAFRASFMERNPTHRALRAAVGRAR